MGLGCRAKQLSIPKCLITMGGSHGTRPESTTLYFRKCRNREFLCVYSSHVSKTTFRCSCYVLAHCEAPREEVDNASI